MFKKQEQIFDKAVQIVCDECRVTPQELRFGRNRVAADARFILVCVIPKGCNKSVVKQFSEEFEVAFIGAANALPRISITPQTTIVGVTNVKCCNRAYGVSLSTPITINATYPAS